MSDSGISSAEVIASARAATGLDDFGELALEPALGRMVDALNNDARLTEMGRTMRQQHLVGRLVNLLKLTELLQRRPELAAAPLGPAVVIVGLPRSGTTKVQRMIAADQRLNHMDLWEALSPVPLADTPDDRKTRIQIAEGFANALRDNAPAFFAAHPIGAQEPEEDMVIMQHSLLTESVDPEVRVPSYVRWLQTQDRRPMYRQWVLWLRVLADAHGKPGQPWILKGTYHGPHLEVLLEVLPHARIVYCHRDPVATISSYCSLVSKMRTLLSDAVDCADVGRDYLAYWSSHLRQTLTVRRRIPAERILDLAYRDIVERIPAVNERIYDFAGVSLPPEAQQAMVAWDKNNAQHKHGRHDYRTADYGLTEAQIADACAEYRTEFRDWIAK